MNANPDTVAQKGRKVPTHGAAQGNTSQDTSNPEGAQGKGLPLGWTEQRIEDLFAPLVDGRTLHQGWSPQCDKVPSPSEDVWGVLKTTSIQAGDFRPEHNKLLPSRLEARPMIEVKEGDILITCAGPRVRCGVSCLVRQTRKRLMMSGKMYRFRVDAARTDTRYVEAFLQTERARQDIDKMKTGSSDSGLNLTHERFRQLSVPVAPFPEQRRIVAEIEKQFTRLEAGVSALKRVQANLKRYRAAVLKAACEGRLVPTEAELTKKRGNKDKVVTKDADASSSFILHPSSLYESGSELLTRILADRRKNWTGRGQYKEPAAPDTNNLPPLPNGWGIMSLETIADVLDPNPAHRMPKAVMSGIPYVSTKDFSQNNEIDFEKAKKISVSDYEALAQKVKPDIGDLLFSRYGTVGAVRSVKTTAPFTASYSIAILRTQLLPQISSFLFWALQSDMLKKQIQRDVRASAQPDLGLAFIRKFAIPLPPLAEQTRIVAEVERRLSVVEELEAAVSANLQRATRLRQSILQKAFTGQLV